MFDLANGPRINLEGQDPEILPSRMKVLIFFACRNFTGIRIEEAELLYHDIATTGLPFRHFFGRKYPEEKVHHISSAGKNDHEYLYRSCYFFKIPIAQRAKTCFAYQNLQYAQRRGSGSDKGQHLESECNLTLPVGFGL